MDNETVTTPDTRNGLFVSHVPPYVVFADGVLVGEHATEEDAEDHFEQLRAARKVGQS
jgi:hypothetical protein